MAEVLAFEEAEPVFRVLDALFVYIYLVELFVRVWITWPDFHRYFSNWFDTLLVLSGLAPGQPSAFVKSWLAFSHFSCRVSANVS